MRRSFQPSATMPMLAPFAPSTTASIPDLTTLSSTRTLHPAREARDVDDLLRSQRLRLEQKDREARDLRRHLQQLSAQGPPPKPRKKHPLLDRKGARKKAPASRPKTRESDEKPVNVQVASMPATPQEAEAVVVDDDGSEDEAQDDDGDAPLYDAMSSTLQQRLNSSTPSIPASSPSPNASSPVPPSPSSDPSALRAQLSEERVARQRAETDAASLRAELTAIHSRVRDVAEGTWDDTDERQRLTRTILDREEKERAEADERSQQDEQREQRAEEVRSALRDAITHLQEKNALIEALTDRDTNAQHELDQAREAIEGLRKDLAVLTNDGALSLEEVQRAVRLSSAPQQRPTSSSSSSSSSSDILRAQAAEMAQLRETADQQQAHVDTLTAELEARDAIISDQRRKLKRTERQLASSPPTQSPTPHRTTRPPSPTPIPPRPTTPPMSGVLRLSATLNPAFSQFTSTSSHSSAVSTAITLSSASSPPITSAVQTGLTPVYRFPVPVRLPLPSAVTLSLHMHRGQSPPMLLASLPLPFPCTPSSAQLTWAEPAARTVSDAQRLIGIVEWAVQSDTDRSSPAREEEEKQQMDHGRRTESVRGSAPPPRSEGMEVVVHSCSLLRQSRLVLHGQCGLLGLDGVMEPMPSASPTDPLRFSVSLPGSVCASALERSALRLAVYDSKYPASPMAHVSVSLAALTQSRSERKAEWLPVLHPRSELPIGSIELGVHWASS